VAVQIPTTLIEENIATASFIIDTTPIRIPKQGNFNTRKVDFSPHYGCYCWKYQIIIDRFIGKAVSVLGPYHGSANDATILVDSGIMETVPNEMKILADRIYYKPNDEMFQQRIYIGYRRPKLTQQELDFNRSLAQERILIENFFARLKSYKNVFAKVWYHGPYKHSIIMYIAVSLVNIEIKLGIGLRSTA